jgi:tetratricopeptide (TPR) repeat protein
VLELNDLQGSIHAPVRSKHRVPMARLFRRDRCRWFDALHEQPKTRPGQAEVRNLSLGGIRFLHRGYLDEYVRERDKVARNLEVVMAGRDALPETAKESFDLGRSLRSAGQHARAFTMFERALELSDGVVLTRAALEFAITTLCETGQSPAAQPLLERLRDTPGGEGPARYLQASVHIQQQQWDEALACLDGLTNYNDNFTSFREDTLWTHRALAHRGLGRPGEAADAAAEALLHNDQAIAAWQILFDCSDGDDERLRRVATTITPDRLVPLFARLNALPPAARDRLAEAVWQIRPGDRVVLAVASQLSGSLEPARTIEWSGRLRSHGLVTLCPLRSLADDATTPAGDRADLLARALHELGAEDLTEDLEDLVPALGDDEVRALLERCLTGWQAAAGPVIVAGSTTPARCLEIVAALEAAGFVDEALAVVRHGAQLDASEVRRLVTARPALADVLRRAAEASGRDDLDPVLVPAA